MQLNKLVQKKMLCSSQNRPEISFLYPLVSKYFQAFKLNIFKHLIIVRYVWLDIVIIFFFCCYFFSNHYAVRQRNDDCMLASGKFVTHWIEGTGEVHISFLVLDPIADWAYIGMRIVVFEKAASPNYE